MPRPDVVFLFHRLQSNILRAITNAPWYVSNFTLHNDLQIPFITEELKRYSTICYNRLIGHENSYVTELSNPLNVRRRLKRQWPSDLKDQRERKKDRGRHNVVHSIGYIGESSLDDRSAQAFPYNIFAYCSICRVDCKFARNKKKSVMHATKENCDKGIASLRIPIFQS
jgi:hypothetical protein